MNSITLILITRDKTGNSKLSKKLEKLGLKVKCLSSIEILPPSNMKVLDDSIRNIFNFDWIIFTSANGVRMFFRRFSEIVRSSLIKELREQHRDGKVKIACVGPSTAEALKIFGLSSDFVPSRFLTDKLGDELASQFNLKSKTILLVRVEIGANEELVAKLRKAGGNVMAVGAYRTVQATRSPPPRFFDDVTDIVFTSPSTVKATISLIGSRQITEQKIRVHCIGPVTARKALDHGLRVDSVAKPHTINGLVSAISRKLQ